jgi:lambda repressor-like predicted transcriptional regulator
MSHNSTHTDSSNNDPQTVAPIHHTDPILAGLEMRGSQLARPYWLVEQTVRDDSGEIVGSGLEAWSTLRELAVDRGLSYNTLRHYSRQTATGRMIKSRRYTDMKITPIEQPGWKVRRKENDKHRKR